MSPQNLSFKFVRFCYDEDCCCPVLQPAANVTQIISFYMKDPEKRTPLHAAAFLGDAEITELLILSGKTVSRFLLWFSRNLETVIQTSKNKSKIKSVAILRGRASLLQKFKVSF